MMTKGGHSGQGTTWIKKDKVAEGRMLGSPEPPGAVTQSCSKMTFFFIE